MRLDRVSHTIEMETVRCNLCGSTQSTLQLLRGDLNLFIDGTFQLVRCAQCGLVYQNPRPVASALEALYTAEYDQYTSAVEAEMSPLARLDRLYGLRKRCWAVMRHERTGRLLDVGCATGDFLAVMRQYPGWEVCGVETNEYASRYARERLGLDVRTGTLETAAWPASTFDVVTLWDVLEHVPDPLATLLEIRRLLRSGGLLVVSTPNLHSLDARLFGPYWIGYEVPRHLFVFSRHSLLALVAKAGFEARELRCFYGSHAAAMSSVRFWLRAKYRAAPWRPWAERLLMTRPLRVLLMPYFLLVDHLRLSSGLTIFCAAGDVR